MYACICAAVTDATVHSAICRGVRTVGDLGDRTGAGTGCGSCQDHLCDMLERLTGARTNVAAAAS